jgi:vitamin B12 transporter
MFRQRFTLAAALVVSLSASYATNAQQGADAPSSDQSLFLKPLTITATRARESLREVLASVSVIDAETLRRQQPRELVDAMRGLPGVDISANGAFGKVTSVFIRGASSSQSLLLVDGQRMGPATSGGASWQYLPPWLIERVEIVRGARSAIYGADAIGGVVQVLTRQADGPASPWFRLGSGSFNTDEVGAGVSGTSGNTSYTLAGHYYMTDGIALRPDGERKGYDNTSGLLRLGHEFSEQFAIKGHWLRSSGNTEFIGGNMDFVHQSAGLRLDASLSDDWSSRLTLGETRDDAINNSDLFGSSVFDTRRRSFSWLNTLRLGEHELQAGIDFQQDVVTGTTQYIESDRDNLAGFAQLGFDWHPFRARVGLRHDDNEAYAGQTTAQLDLGWAVDAQHQLRAGFGQGFRAPTFNELYFPGFGNPELNAETSDGLELGASGVYTNWRWDLALYHKRVDDLISTVFVDGQFSAENVAEARLQGIEAALAGNWRAWQWRLAATAQSPEDRETGNRLRRRAARSARVDLDREWGNWSLGGSLVSYGERFDDAAMQQRLGGFGLLNLRLGWHLAERWSLRATLDNALDKSYVLARDGFNDFDYQQPGRQFSLTLNYGG